jgi:hypothetical protein
LGRVRIAHRSPSDRVRDAHPTICGLFVAIAVANRGPADYSSG